MLRTICSVVVSSSLFVPAAFIFLSPSIVWACSCVPGQTVCGQLFTSDVAFVGRVTRDTGQSDLGSRNAVVKVEEVFNGLGSDVTEVEINTGAGTTCYFPLKEGERWVIFGTRSPNDQGVIFTGVCSLSFLVNGNDTLLDALRASRFQQESRVVGTVLKQSSRYAFAQPLGAGVNVSLEKEGERLESVTLASGRFEFRSVPPGQWVLRAESPGLAEKAGSSEPIDVVPNQCATGYMLMVADGHIRGRVLDAAGNPVEGATVEVFARNRQDTAFDAVPSASAKSDADGNYDIGGLPAHSYIVGINGQTSKDVSPNPPGFFGSRERNTAFAIFLGEGEVRRGIDLRR